MFFSNPSIIPNIAGINMNIPTIIDTKAITKIMLNRISMIASTNSGILFSTSSNISNDPIVRFLYFVIFTALAELANAINASKTGKNFALDFVK